MASELSHLTKLARKATMLQKKIERLAAQQKNVTEELQSLLDKTIPDFMTELDLSEVKLRNGKTVRLVQIVAGHISKQNKAIAHAWLKKHRFADLIKHEFKIPFKKGTDKEARAFAKWIKKEGLEFTDNSSVNHNTLNAWIREQAGKGNPIPKDIFGIYEATTTKIF